MLQTKKDYTRVFKTWVGGRVVHDTAGSELLTVRQTAANVLSALQAAGVDAGEARAQTRLILEHCLELDSAQQLTRSEQIVSARQQAQIRAICEQRSARVPLQYCLGYAYFWGMKLAVEPGVLIPRSDTEALVQVALQKIRARTAAQPPIETIADIGTGSGAIAIALARELPDVKMVAVDICAQALEVAAKNAHAQGVTQQIDFMPAGHWASVLSGVFDVIVSNPPYLNKAHKEFMQPEVYRYEPEQALFGPGIDGLGFYEELAQLAPQYLKPRGEIFLEVGDGQAKAVTNIFNSAGWKQIELHRDLNGLIRVVCASKSGP